ncbi:LysE family transporter [Nocardioides bruguierae]|uniref:LysE family transporter n=1 Tax=Nocardioides bruguierae TaxID=2945102 RepID=UPI002020CFD9|nr:LysE family transporter [Nocardioides bruguierae]MCL8023811.1 LysE family transporter [Nocardioides bruguierae]
MGSALLAGLVTGWAIALPVGAIGALLVSLGAQQGWRVGAAGALGVATVDGLYAGVAVLAGAAAAAALAPVADALTLLAGMVLLAVALLMARAALRPAGPARAQPRLLSPLHAYLLLLGLTAVNPTTVVYFVAVVLGNDAVVSGTSAAAVFVAAALAASASWQLVLAGSGALLGRVASSDPARRVTGLVAAAVVAALAVRALATVLL